VRPDKQLQTLNPDCGLYQWILNRSVDDSDGLVQQIVEVLSTIPELSLFAGVAGAVSTDPLSSLSE
jgi:hypothetical protein